MNVLWGQLNAFAGVYLLATRPVTVEVGVGFGAVALGALLLGVYLAIHFEKVQRGRREAGHAPTVTSR